MEEDSHLIILTPEQMKKLEDLPDDSPALRRMAEEWGRRRGWDRPLAVRAQRLRLLTDPELAPLVREIQAEAWDEGWREAAEVPADCPTQGNPYRASA